MFFQKFGKFSQQGDRMSSAAINWASALIARERVVTGVNKPALIVSVARKARVTPGQIEGAIRGRVKDLKSRFIERIRLAFITEATAEINRLAHEIQIARQSGLRPDDDAVIAAQAAMDRLQEALEG